MTAVQYLESIAKSVADVEKFTSRSERNGRHPNRGWMYDSELGWIHADAMHEGDGVYGSDTFYHYEEDGARLVVNHSSSRCRIHAYGNSFTHCDQVNDGETWAEYLAAHLEEPIRNYGVGGYSVYQAYRRMKKIHREGKQKASHIILNIFEDDHFRNLDAWRGLRHGRHSNCGFTLPHLRVDRKAQQVREHENLLTTAGDVLKLCDTDFLSRTFADDPILEKALHLRNLCEIDANALDPVPISVGLIGAETDSTEARQIKDEYAADALFATQHVIEQVEEFCRETDKKLLVILSFGKRYIAQSLRGEEVFDRSFTKWLKLRHFPVVDMRDAFKEAYKHAGQDVEEFLEPYYVGHHSPLGNYFTAGAIRESVVEWLEPRPLPYARTESIRS